MLDPIIRNAEWLLFVGVLANQAGVPVPATPWLLAAGALAASGQVSLVALVAGGAGAALCADLGWYGLGRWRGTAALASLLRALRQPPTTVDRVVRAFRTHRLGFVWAARFLPELNPIAASLSASREWGCCATSSTRSAVRSPGWGYGSAADSSWLGLSPRAPMPARPRLA